MGCDRCGEVHEGKLYGWTGRRYLCAECCYGKRKMRRVFPAYEITPEMMGKAEARAKLAKDSGWYSKGESIRDGAGYLAGVIGEAFAWVALDRKPERMNRKGGDEKYDYDLLLPDGRKADVKTKERTVLVKPSYLASITRHSMDRQEFDVAIFCSAAINLSKVEVCGWMTKEQFKLAAKRMMKKGELEPGTKFPFKEDCWNVPYGILNPIEELGIWRNRSRS